MRTDGQTDVTKLIVAFRNFVNAPKIILCGRITCVYLMVRTQTMNKLRHGRTAVDDTSHCTSTDWSDYNVHKQMGKTCRQRKNFAKTDSRPQVRESLPSNLLQRCCRNIREKKSSNTTRVESDLKPVKTETYLNFI